MKEFFKEIQISAEEFDKCVKNLKMEKVGENEAHEFYTYISKKNNNKILVKVSFYLDVDYTSIANVTMCILGKKIKVKEKIQKPALTDAELFEYTLDFDSKNEKYAAQAREDFILENGIKLYFTAENNLYKDKKNDDIIYLAIKDNDGKIHNFQEILKI